MGAMLGIHPPEQQQVPEDVFHSPFEPAKLIWEIATRGRDTYDIQKHETFIEGHLL